MYVHGDNLAGKIAHSTKYQDEESRRFLSDIAEEYEKWKQANTDLVGPSALPNEAEDRDLLCDRTRLLRDYKSFIDDKKYVEKFDARSNLHSSVIEEFLFYLFKDLVQGFGDRALLGKSHAFKDLFFVPPSYESMLERPHAQVERKDHDFVIGTTVSAEFYSRDPAGDGADSEREALEFDLPAIAIECKTYLDKTMLEGSSRAADEIKARNPNGLYFVMCERLKLSGAVNLRKYAVDQIYVLRRERNIDREYRLLDGYEGNDITDDVVIRLFDDVRTALVTDWAVGLDSGIERGWLL